MSESRVLVVGATGQLGGVIARKLIDAGVKVRALGAQCARRSRAFAPKRRNRGRRPARRAEADRGLPRRRSDRRHCQQQHGQGTDQPDAHRPLRLPEPLRGGTQHRRSPADLRLVQGVAQDAPVDIFRVKWYIEDAIRRSGVPHVMLRPTAFMDIWIDQILAKGIREKGVATIFGDGIGVANYIAVDDVARVRREDPVAPGGRERGRRRRRPVEPVAERSRHAGRTAVQVVRQATARAGRWHCACSRPSSGRSTRSPPG